jgi:hypothetical protein
MAEKPWYQVGEEGVKRSREVDAANELKRDQSRQWRFRLQKNEKAKITFLDNPVFFYTEHTVKLGNDFLHLTCIQERDTCPMCQANMPQSYCLAATVINHNEYVSKRTGEKFRNQKQLIVLKGRAKNAVMRQIEKNDGNIQFMMFDVERGPEMTGAATGEIFEPIKRIEIAKLAKVAPKPPEDCKDVKQFIKDWLKPINYPTELAPKSADDLRRIMGGQAPVGANDDPFGGDSSTEEAPAGAEAPKDADTGSVEDLI